MGLELHLYRSDVEGIACLLLVGLRLCMRFHQTTLFIQDDRMYVPTRAPSVTELTGHKLIEKSSDDPR